MEGQIVLEFQHGLTDVTFEVVVREELLLLVPQGKGLQPLQNEVCDGLLLLLKVTL